MAYEAIALLLDKQTGTDNRGWFLNPYKPAVERPRPALGRGAAAPAGPALPRPDDGGAMNSDPKLIADVLVNLFGALGTLVVAYNLRRVRSARAGYRRAPSCARLVAALFLMRCLALEHRQRLSDRRWSTCWPPSTPLAGLLVAEGLLRRHAPRWLKLAYFAAAVLWSRCHDRCPGFRRWSPAWSSSRRGRRLRRASACSSGRRDRASLTERRERRRSAAS